MRVVVLEEHNRQLVELLEDAGLDVDPCTRPGEVPDAEILLASPALAAAAAHRMPSLRWIQSTWAGVDDLLAGGLPPGVVLTKLEGVFGPQMREFVFGHLLARSQRVCEIERRRTWHEEPPDGLAGSRMGVMGTGSIGRAIAATAVHLGLHVVGCSRSGTPAPEFLDVLPIERRLEFAEGLHHLVAVLPSTPGTIGLVDHDLIERLAPGATLINVGRGNTVEVEAVISALGSGRLSHAVLDVLPVEPLPSDHHWWRVPGLVITSHTAAWSRPGDVAGFFVTNHGRWTRGQPLVGVVDPDRGY